MIAMNQKDPERLIEELASCIDFHAEKLARRGSSTLDADDLRQAARLEIVRVAHRYDPSRCRPLTFFNRRIYGAMVDAMRDARPAGIRRDLSRATAKQLSSFDGEGRDKFEPVDSAAKEDRELIDGAERLRDLFARLSPKARGVMESRYLRGKTFREISAALQISVSGAEGIHRRTIGAMRGWSEFEGLESKEGVK
jgi:RNA polymerase sigma factor (sigma-70 family)